MPIHSEIQDYLESLPADRRTMLDTLHSLIMGLYPDAEQSMKYKMPTYQFGDGWVAIANQKHYVSLYTCGYHHIVRFKQNQPRIKTGKGCINFSPSAALPVKDVEEVIRHAISQPKAI